MESLRKLAAAGDQAAQQRIENIDRIRKKVDNLARKEMRLSQQLSSARGGGGGGGGGFGGGGGPPGGFGATPPGGNFDKSKGSLSQLSNAMGQLEQKTRGGSGAMRELDELAFEVGKKAAAFRGVAIAINTVINAAQAAAKFLIQFNDSLLELNKILQLSVGGLQNIGDQLFRLSAGTGVAIDQTVEIATAFARAGLSGRGYGSVVSLTETALVGLQGTTLDATQVTTVMIQVIQQIEAGMRGLQKEIVTTSQLFDILGRAEDITASKATDVAAALKRSAASLFATGASMSEVTAIISVLQERTQRGGDVIGTALKTLAARTSNSASEASKALKSIGVATIDAQGNLRNTFEVLSDTADAFGLLTEAEQANIAVKTAGIRQVEVFRAALNDFNRVREVEETLANASGDAARKQAVEQQKLANVIERTKLAMQELVKSASEGIFGQAFDFAIRSGEALLKIFVNINNALSGSVAH
jgi:TP901 family phage tail tape measure protein